MNGDCLMFKSIIQMRSQNKHSAKSAVYAQYNAMSKERCWCMLWLSSVYIWMIKPLLLWAERVCKRSKHLKKTSCWTLNVCPLLTCDARADQFSALQGKGHLFYSEYFLSCCMCCICNSANYFAKIQNCPFYKYILLYTILLH